MSASPDAHVSQLSLVPADRAISCQPLMPPEPLQREGPSARCLHCPPGQALFRLLLWGEKHLPKSLKRWKALPLECLFYGGIYGPERDSGGPNTLIKINHLKHSPVVLHAWGLHSRKSLEEPIWFSSISNFRVAAGKTTSNPFVTFTEPT